MNSSPTYVFLGILVYQLLLAWVCHASSILLSWFSEFQWWHFCDWHWVNPLGKCIIQQLFNTVTKWAWPNTNPMISFGYQNPLLSFHGNGIQCLTMALKDFSALTFSPSSNPLQTRCYGWTGSFALTLLEALCFLFLLPEHFSPKPCSGCCFISFT